MTSKLTSAGQRITKSLICQLVHDIIRFSDMNASELRKHIGLRSGSNLRFHADVSEAPILPKNVSPYDFNWRGYSAVTNDVKNQRRFEVSVSWRFYLAHPTADDFFLDPGNSVMIVCDEKLKEVFGCESISAMGIPELLVKHHLLEQ
ncbi:unnamed protein product [Lactuca virosa]|uniref:DM2 domain-containing protein n=1 Tax=Lactuca virosa TaxID=75947 RepID=A0AAU9LV84_9ASTR|nr:unnamed protein product [Lactuca virosa]